MPADNIKRAIRRGTGEEPGVTYEEAQYEGYGPGGAAVIVDVLTDNKNRTVGEMRHTAREARRQPRGHQRGRLDVHEEGLHRRRESEGRRREADGRRARRRRRRHAGRRRQLGSAQRPDAFNAVRDAVKALGIEPATAEVSMIPQNYVKLEGKPAQQMLRADGSARRSRRRAARLVELRHRGEGDRGLARVRVFGIDPGSERTGYGCVETDGSRHRLVALRRHRARRVSVVSRKAARDPPPRSSRCSSNASPTASPSRTSFTPPTCAARSSSGTRAASRCWPRSQPGLPVVEYTPAEIKRAVVGYGRAEKHAGAADGQAAARPGHRAVAARRGRRAGRGHLPLHCARRAAVAGASAGADASAGATSWRHACRPARTVIALPPGPAPREAAQPHRRRRQRRRLRRVRAAVDVLRHWATRAARRRAARSTRTCAKTRWRSTASRRRSSRISSSG